jgi:asparagine synthase (glutamine-hydrolysing)
MAGADAADWRLLRKRNGFVALRSAGSPALLHSDGPLSIAVSGMPRRVATPPAAGDAQAAIAAFLDDYRVQGPAALASLSGPFCIALIDDRSDTLLLAIDRIGIAQLFFAPTADGIAFATSLDLLCRHPQVARRVSAQALFDYMYFHMIPSPLAIVEGATRLMPGECLRWDVRSAERVRYWQPRFEERESRPFVSLKEGFVGALRGAVEDAAAGVRVGTFLSGGTDSSTITGLLQRHGGDVDAYSIGFEAEGYDEMEYARIAARHFGVRHHEYYVTPDDVVDTVPRLASAFDQPFGNSSAVPVYCCARMAAADGVSRMIAGDGGDELFGGNARYATQYLFSLYEDVPRWLRRGVVEPVAKRLPLNVGVTRKLRRYVEQAAVPMPARTETYSLLRRFGHESVFTPEVMRRVDTEQPLALQTDAYFNPTARSLINRQLSLDLKFTLADNDLPKVTRACALAGLDVVFPMLDSRVVDFSLRLPPHLKLRRTKLRYFFKEALRGFLPDEIIAKTKHGFGLPFGPWLMKHERLHALAFDSLSDLRRRRIIHGRLIDALPAQVAEHPGYYGPMVWILMMLEQWFRVHAPATDGSSL